MTEARIEKDQVPVIYRRIASLYDAWAWLTERNARTRCLQLAAIQDGEDVLEVAVGTGLAFVEILKSNPSGNNAGIDLTSEMLARAQERAERTGNQRYQLREGDAYNLEFPDASFDILVNNYMFDLLPERDFLPVLEEFRRVLRPGGRLALVNMTIGRHWYNGVWDWIYRLNPAWLGGCRGVKLLPYLQMCGFVQTQRDYVSQFTFPSEVVFGRVP
jgi:ubiquinone/menaquinone biosynthesis C-methylase UbiE